MGRERIALVLAFMSALAGTDALAAKDGVLQGAWTLNETECSRVFAMSDGEMNFIDRGSSLNTGIIIRGDAMKGPNSNCTIGGISRQKDVYKVRLMCSTAIMFDDIAVLLKVIDDDHFARVDPDFPEIKRTYKRCSP